MDFEEDDITSQTALLSIETEDEKIPNFIDISGDEDEDEDDDDFVRELTANELRDFRTRLTRSASSTPAYDRSSTATTSLGGIIKPGMSVELNDGDFLYIHHISRNNGSHVKGILLRRTRKLDDILPKKYNELYAVLKTGVEGSDPTIDECLVSRPLADIWVARDIVFTNRPFPALSFRERPHTYTSWDEVEEKAILVCRWKYTEYCDAGMRKVTSQSILWLKENECTPGSGIPDLQLRRMWRGGSSNLLNPNTKSNAKPRRKNLPDDIVEVTRGEFESSKSQKRPQIIEDLTNGDSDVEEQETTISHSFKCVKRDSTYERRCSSVITERFTRLPSMRNPSRHIMPPPTSQTKYRLTYGDICTGAGGMATGAQTAGFNPVFFLDNCKDACETLAKNFNGTKILHNDIFDFCTGRILYRNYFRVDVLHISFPCQPHSLAHTREGKNDDKNIATGYSAMPILNKCRPRVVTLEQTSGIVHKGGFHYRALLHQLTAMQYSVRVKIINCAEYGNVQPRKRLIIIAACPGETLPQYPKPTHGIGRGLKPFVTIRDILTKLLGFNVPPHMQSYNSKAGTPYSDKQPLRGCITTDGGKSNLHPNGKRTFTLQELACLAGFPPSHRFVGCDSSIKRQIGNAVPRVFATALFTEIAETLRKSDEAEKEWEPETIVIE